MMFKIIEEFKRAMHLADLIPPNIIIADGKKHRFSTSNKNSDTAGEYCLYLDNIPAGYFHDWRTGLFRTWRSDLKQSYSFQERLAYKKKIEVIRHQKDETQKIAAIEAKKIWDDSGLATEGHPYLVRKQVKSYGLRVYQNKLIVPVLQNGKLFSLQYISPNGEKRFLPGGRVNGCYFSIGNPGRVLAITEGYATGATVFENTNYPVAIAFNAANLLSVATHLRERFPNIKIIIYADDDRQNENNPGLIKARKAAVAAGALLTSPTWPKDAPASLTDFNDLVCWSKRKGTAT